MTISQVAKKYDMTTDTLRYYERIGLLPPIKRNKSGNRDYSEAMCNWVYFIKCMRGAGLSIEILIEYVSLIQKEEDTTALRKELLVEQKNRVEEKIEVLNGTLEYLTTKIDSYDKALGKFEEKLK